jgi:GWxTD domain-containing protein
MPAGLLARLPVEQVEAILLHELAHIRRCDYLVNLLQRLVEGLLFYHPVVWWISRVIRVERENCCDDIVVAKTGNAHEYAVALAALEQDRWSGSEPAVAATGGSLMKRIRRLLYPKGSSGAWTPVTAAVVLVSIAAGVLSAWQVAPQLRGSAVTKRGPGPAEVTPYLNWLNQDVVYLIADDERAAFLRLASDPEREKFIEQFWLRRDPTPNTAANEFKDEHYRRIEFVGRRFTTPSGKPGWQTDRGRICIVYGPPDEIETHPSGTFKAYGYEIWKYRHMESIGDNLYMTFIDRTNTGDYQIAPGNAADL